MMGKGAKIKPLAAAFGVALVFVGFVLLAGSLANAELLMGNEEAPHTLQRGQQDDFVGAESSHFGDQDLQAHSSGSDTDDAGYQSGIPTIGVQIDPFSGLNATEIVAHVRSQENRDDAKPFEGDVCLEKQPYPRKCFQWLPEGLERLAQQALDAVGVLKLPQNGVSCAGVLLGTTQYTFFLTSSRCLPDESNAKAATVVLRSCRFSHRLGAKRLYAINRRLGYAMLELDNHNLDLRTRFGYRRLRGTKPITSEKVFIASGTVLTMVNREEPVRIQPFQPIAGCDVETPTSRVAYAAPWMDPPRSDGAPVFSASSGAVVAVHACGDCRNSAMNSGVASHAIVADLKNKALLVNDFVWTSGQ